MIAAVGAFARVMKQQSEAQQGQVFDLRKNFGKAAMRGILVRGEFGELFDSDQGVFVHGIAMVEVRNNQAKDAFPLRKHGRQESGVVHDAQSLARVWKCKNAVQLRPQGWRALAKRAEGITGLLHTALGFGSQGDAVPRDEFEQAQNDGWIAGQLRRRSEIDAVTGNRELRVGEPRAPIAKMGSQGFFGSLNLIERAADLFEDDARVAEILAHQIGRLTEWHVRLGGKRLLRVEAQQVLIAPRLVMEKTAQRVHEPGGLSQAAGYVLIRLAQLTQPIDEVQVSQPARRFLDVGLQMIEGALKLLVPLERQLGEVTGECVGLPFEEGRKLVFELGIQIGRTQEQAAVQ